MGGFRTGMEEDGHGPCGNCQGVVWFIGLRQFQALLRYPDSCVLSLIMNCGRVVDFGWDGWIYMRTSFESLHLWRRAGRRKLTRPPSRGRGLSCITPPGRPHSLFYCAPCRGARELFLSLCDALSIGRGSIRGGVGPV